MMETRNPECDGTDGDQHGTENGTAGTGSGTGNGSGTGSGTNTGTGGGQPRTKYVVHDVTVSVLAERVQYDSSDGRLVTESLTDYTR